MLNRSVSLSIYSITVCAKATCHLTENCLYSTANETGNRLLLFSEGEFAQCRHFPIVIIAAL